MNEAWITGTSILASSGIGNDAVWEAAMLERQTVSERAAPAEVQEQGQERLAFPCYAIGPLDAGRWIGPSAFDRLAQWGLQEDADFVYLLAAIRLALDDAKLRPDSSARVSLIVGHENLGVVGLVDRIVAERGGLPGSNAGEGFLQPFQRYRQPFYNLQTFPYLFYLSHLFGFNGFTYAVNNACASGLYALELARQLIASGSTDVAVVACSDYAHLSEYLWLDERGAMARTGPLRPFDLRRGGSVLGDGAGAIVLESAAGARKRNASAYCAYAGGSFAQDNWQMTLPDVPSHRYASVLSDTLARHAADGVDLLVPHGAGSPMWDLYEAQEIRRAARSLAIEVPPVTSFKGYFGHALGASAMIETVLLIQAMRRGVAPRTLNFAEPDPKIGLPLLTQTREMRINAAVKAVPAYGGFHAACVFKAIG